MFFNSFICIPAMTVYFLIKYFILKNNIEKYQKIVSILGTAVFGVYLIEKFCRALTDSIYVISVPVVGSFGASLIWCFATCCIAFALIIVLKNIPYVKKIINQFI